MRRCTTRRPNVGAAESILEEVEQKKKATKQPKPDTVHLGPTTFLLTDLYPPVAEKQVSFSSEVAYLPAADGEPVEKGIIRSSPTMRSLEVLEQQQRDEAEPETRKWEEEGGKRKREEQDNELQEEGSSKRKRKRRKKKKNEPADFNT